MKYFWNNYFWLITFILSYLLFWIFGDIIFFLSILVVIGEILVLKGIYRIKFFYFDVIIISIYLFLCLICLLFIFVESFKVFLIVIGVWMTLTFFFHKRC
jgi:hypothetical protein